MRLLFATLATLLALPAGAQELRANVSLVITAPNSVSFSFSVANQSTAPVAITSAQVTLSPAGAVFDTFGTTPLAPTPNPGANNDGTSHNSVTFATNLLPGQTLSTSGGDIDGSAITGVNITVGFSNGESVSGPLTLSGATWSGQFTRAAQRLYPIELTWQAPTQNTDGTPYTNPAGYNIYWGSTQGNYANSKRITDPATQMDTVMVPQGRWYFVATAINTTNNESEYSNVAEGNAQPAPESPFLSGPLEVPPEASGLAWMIFTIRNQLLFVEAGSVQSGAGCDPDQAIRGQMPDGQVRNLYLVAAEDVNRLPSIPDGELAFFAECSNP